MAFGFQTIIPNLTSPDYLKKKPQQKYHSQTKQANCLTMVA